MGNIVWLASYPKSGNTWFRVFLTNLLENRDTPANINNLYPTVIASSRILFDEISGLPSAELTQFEIDYIRRENFIYESRNSENIIYHKIHDAWIILPDGKPLIPYEATKCVLYFIRNPLDVVISFSNHLGKDIDFTIEIMNNPDYAFCKNTNKLYNQTRQKLLTWSMHVDSWVNQSKLPILVVRYEDMVTNTFQTFKSIIKFLGLPNSDEQIKKAIEFSSFEILKKQEEKNGFNEKSMKTKYFFRKGKINEWKKKLKTRQIQKIINTHEKIMKQFGYL